MISIDCVAWTYSLIVIYEKIKEREGEKERTTRLGFRGGMPGMGRPLICLLKTLTSVSAPLSARTTG